MEEKVFDLIDNYEEKYLEFFKDICTFETPSRDKASMDEMMDYVENFARGEGFEVTRVPFENCGDQLVIEMNPNGEKAYACLAHMDTVHAKGIFGYPCIKIEDGKMTAPGAIDCKGGAVVAFLGMKALKDAGYDKNIRLLLTSDEEISNVLGGEKEMKLIADTVKGFRGALNFEPARTGKIVVQRKGILRLEVDVKGVGGHSGAAYFTSASAILEAAHKIVELESHSEQGKPTYNCSLIKGGTVANNIPDRCTFTVDIRVLNNAEMKEAEDFVHEVASRTHVEGTSATVRLVSKRPPMERTPETMELFEKINETSKRHGWGELVPTLTAGGADSAYTQLAGTPSVCSMGPDGGNGHRPDEYVILGTVKERAKLFAAFVLEN